MKESRLELFSGLINSAGKSIQRIKAEKMKKYNLSAAHTTCLCRLEKAGHTGLTQGQLAALEGMDRAQISRVLAELQRRNYVEALPHDGRYKKRYALTPAGQEITGEIQDIILQTNRFVSGSIPPEDIETFYRTLRTITENLERAAQAR